MATVRGEIGKYIIGRLKIYGDNNEQKYDTAIDIKTDAERLQYFQKNVINPNTRDIIEYTPASLNFEDTPAGVKNIDKTTWNISYEFGFTGLDDADEDFEEQKLSIEQLRLDLLNTSRFTIDVNGETYQCKSIATSLSRSGEIRPLAGYKRILHSMGITIVSGIGLRFGEDELYELQKEGGEFNNFEYLELDTGQKNGGTGVEYQANQLEGADISKSQYKRDIWSDSITLDFQEQFVAHRDLYNKAMFNDAPDEVYQLRITPPFDIAVPIVKDVLLEVNRIANTGEGITFTIKFREALNA
jgi:hypothetical protein